MVEQSWIILGAGGWTVAATDTGSCKRSVYHLQNVLLIILPYDVVWKTYHCPRFVLMPKVLDRNTILLGDLI